MAQETSYGKKRYIISVIVLIGLIFVGYPFIIKATDSENIAIIKANGSSAASTVITFLEVGDERGPMDAITAASVAERKLNAGLDGIPNTPDDPQNPYDPDMYAFSNVIAMPGTVLIKADPLDNSVKIEAYGKDMDTILYKKVIRDEEEEER